MHTGELQIELHFMRNDLEAADNSLCIDTRASNNAEPSSLPYTCARAGSTPSTILRTPRNPRCCSENVQTSLQLFRERKLRTSESNERPFLPESHRPCRIIVSVRPLSNRRLPIIAGCTATTTTGTKKHTHMFTRILLQ